jgi:hypothetical protein
MTKFTNSIIVIFLCGLHPIIAQNNGSEDELMWFEDFVGKWNLEESVQLSKDSEVVKASKNSNIYFVPNRKVLAVEDISKDGNNVFLGFHAYDNNTKQYINWGTASTFYQGWGHGSISEDGLKLFLSGIAYDPRNQNETTIEWSGEWIKQDRNRHIFRAYIMSEGEKFLFKEAVYIRK